MRSGASILGFASWDLLRFAAVIAATTEAPPRRSSRRGRIPERAYRSELNAVPLCLPGKASLFWIILWLVSRQLGHRMIGLLNEHRFPNSIAYIPAGFRLSSGSQSVALFEQFRNPRLPSSRLVLPSSVANPVATYTDCSWSHSERRFALIDFKYRSKAGRLRLYEAGAYLFAATGRGPCCNKT
jgi:hypothetical protein